MKATPIFIHSLFRSGSTYLFNVFRRSNAGYWCYQEALHELAVFARNDRDLLLVDHGKEKKILLRHPVTESDYFKELHEVWGFWHDILQEEVVYDSYFEQKDPVVAGVPYWRVLATESKGRAVFQECRTSGRIQILKEGLESYHIYLWRNPWDQWWSYKVASYFDSVNQIVASSRTSPDCLVRLCLDLEIHLEPNLDLANKFAFYSDRPLTSEQSYLLFYMLWCLALKEGTVHADNLINIDRLSESEEYRRDVITKLEAESDIKGINVSDCKVPQAVYDKRDEAFFTPLEERVHVILLQHGWSEDDLFTIKQLRAEYKPATQKQQEYSQPVTDYIEQSSRARELTRRYETDLSQQKQYLSNRLVELASMLHAAEAKANEAEAKASEAEAKAEQAEAKAEHYTSELRLVYSSSSWRVTAPLRWVSFQLNLLKTHGLKEYIKSKPLLYTIALKLVHSSNLVQSALNRTGFQQGFRYDLLEESSSNKELLIDITHVHANDLKTGIQRVVRSILQQFESENFKWLQDKYDLQPVYLSDAEGFWSYRYVINNQVVVPKKQDVFVGLDLVGSITEAENFGLFKDWIKRGVNIHMVIYDVLPISNPKWWPSGVSKQHELWLQSAIKIANKLICISEDVSNNVTNYIRQNEIDIKDKEVVFFHLGADIASSKPSLGLPENHQLVIEQIESKISFLMVSTIEPRKGHVQVLDAFEQLWSANVDINLVFVGKKGWLVDTLLQRIESHPELGKRFFWLDGISDEFLEKVYAASTCLIAASYGEGFGLPLIEAAQNEIAIIARDIPVFREVAGEHASYFIADEPQDLALAINNWLECYENNTHPTSDQMPWLTWKQSASVLLDYINEDSRIDGRL